MADDEAVNPPDEKPKRTRRPRTAAPTTSPRVEKRGKKIAETIVEATNWTLGREGKDDLGFAETLRRDADKIGLALAGVAERFKPFGLVVDKVFGEGGPLSVLVALSSAIRAGRHSLVERRERRQAEAEAAAEQARIEQEFEQVEQGHFREFGVDG